MSSTIDIRELTSSDIDEFLSWRREVLNCVFAEEISENESIDMDEIIDANRDFFERHAGVDHFCYVASIDNEDVGCGAICLYEEMPSPDNPSGKCSYLMNIYVRDDSRGNHVGHAIVKHLVEESKRKDAQKIFLESTKMAKELYASCGFVTMEDMMKHSS